MVDWLFLPPRQFTLLACFCQATYKHCRPHHCLHLPLLSLPMRTIVVSSLRGVVGCLGVRLQSGVWRRLPRRHRVIGLPLLSFSMLNSGKGFGSRVSVPAPGRCVACSLSCCCSPLHSCCRRTIGPPACSLTLSLSLSLSLSGAQLGFQGF